MKFDEDSDETRKLNEAIPVAAWFLFSSVWSFDWCDSDLPKTGRPLACSLKKTLLSIDK